jgi:hypothetical protein
MEYKYTNTKACTAADKKAIDAWTPKAKQVAAAPRTCPTACARLIVPSACVWQWVAKAAQCEDPKAVIRDVEQFTTMCRANIKAWFGLDMGKGGEAVTTYRYQIQDSLLRMKAKWDDG